MLEIPGVSLTHLAEQKKGCVKADVRKSCGAYRTRLEEEKKSCRGERRVRDKVVYIQDSPAKAAALLSQR